MEAWPGMLPKATPKCCDGQKHFMILQRCQAGGANPDLGVPCPHTHRLYQEAMPKTPAAPNAQGMCAAAARLGCCKWRQALPPCGERRGAVNLAGESSRLRQALLPPQNPTAGALTHHDSHRSPSRKGCGPACQVSQDVAGNIGKHSSRLGCYHRGVPTAGSPLSSASFCIPWFRPQRCGQRDDHRGFWGSPESWERAQSEAWGPGSFPGQEHPMFLLAASLSRVHLMTPEAGGTHNKSERTYCRSNAWETTTFQQQAELAGAVSRAFTYSLWQIPAPFTMWQIHLHPPHSWVMLRFKILCASHTIRSLLAKKHLLSWQLRFVQLSVYQPPAYSY